jgi:hypothetical protein
MSSSTVELTCPIIQCVLGSIFSGKRLEPVADYSLLLEPRLPPCRGLPSLTVCAFMLWCLATEAAVFCCWEAALTDQVTLDHWSSGMCTLLKWFQTFLKPQASFM